MSATGPGEEERGRGNELPQGGGESSDDLLIDDFDLDNMSLSNTNEAGETIEEPASSVEVSQARSLADSIDIKTLKRIGGVLQRGDLWFQFQELAEIKKGISLAKTSWIDIQVDLDQGGTREQAIVNCKKVDGVLKIEVTKNSDDNSAATGIVTELEDISLANARRLFKNNYTSYLNSVVAELNKLDPKNVVFREFDGQIQYRGKVENSTQWKEISRLEANGNNSQSFKKIYSNVALKYLNIDGVAGLGKSLKVYKVDMTTPEEAYFVRFTIRGEAQIFHSQGKAFLRNGKEAVSSDWKGIERDVLRAKIQKGYKISRS